jgi:MFS transporter, DHA2 family, multidrug resistance protein
MCGRGGVRYSLILCPNARLNMRGFSSKVVIRPYLTAGRDTGCMTDPDERVEILTDAANQADQVRAVLDSDGVTEGLTRVGDRPTDVTTTLTDVVAPQANLDAQLIKIALVCLIPSTMASADFTVVYVAQRTFMEVFRTPQVVAAWTATGYGLALAAAMAPSGWAANRFGARRLFVGSVVLFTSSSALCALAPSIALLVAARVVQGIGGGLLLPTIFTVLIRAAGHSRLGRVMSLMSISMVIGPILGPIFGGWLIDAFGWQWVFLINVPIGVVAAILAAKILPIDASAEDEPLDIIGVLLLAPGLAMLLYGVSELPASGTVTNSKVLVPALIGTVMIVVFVLYALQRAQTCMIDLRLLRLRVVLAANIVRFLFSMSFFGTGLILPLYFQQVLGASPMRAGAVLIPQSIGAAASSLVVGHIVDRRGPRGITLMGTAVVTAGMGLFIWGIGQRQVSVPVLMAALAVIGIGASCSMIPVASAAVHQLDGRHAAHGSTLFRINQEVGAAIGIAVWSVLLTSLSTSGAVHAYVVVLSTAAVVGALCLVPSAFLPTTAQA